jgi:hypothetical protein
LVVIAIIAVLIGLLLPAVQKVREAANRTTCTNNLKQLALACHNYHDSFGVLPPARIARDAYATWPVLIMPYIEQDAVFKLWDIHQGYASQPARPTDPPGDPGGAARLALIKTFFCPSRRAPMISPSSENGGPNGDKAGACGDYACCAGDGTSRNQRGANGAMINGHVLDHYIPLQSGENGVDQPNANPPDLPLIPIMQFTSYTNLNNILDGTSNTFLLGEKHIRRGFFGTDSDGDKAYYSGTSYDTAQRAAGSSYPLARDPDDNNSNHRDMFGSYHPGICQFAFADAHVTGIPVTIDSTNLKRLANRLDGLTISIDH